ncbi:hypothetical protein EJ08DRAFT_659141 [Tothia fuscella]|uniref:Serine protease n=1 Tax=Tothia fuscella TaxID=1048955 RepID=A0A9P4U112_9PEZI|nr:hypothetical protein EJ08DRAFT_659141 [Tothia fuscella]
MYILNIPIFWSCLWVFAFIVDLYFSISRSTSPDHALVSFHNLIWFTILLRGIIIIIFLYVCHAILRELAEAAALTNKSVDSNGYKPRASSCGFSEITGETRVKKSRETGCDSSDRWSGSLDNGRESSSRVEATDHKILKHDGGESARWLLLEIFPQLSTTDLGSDTDSELSDTENHSGGSPMQPPGSSYEERQSSRASKTQKLINDDRLYSLAEAITLEISIQRADRSNSLGLGTGIVVQTFDTADFRGSVILTNRHNVFGAYSRKPGWVKWVDVNGNHQQRHFKVLATSPTSDAALIVVNHIFPRALPLADFSIPFVPEKGQTIFAVGYPGGAKMRMLGQMERYVTKETDPYREDRVHHKDDRLLYTTNITDGHGAGSSGSAIFEYTSRNFAGLHFAGTLGKHKGSAVTQADVARFLVNSGLLVNDSYRGIVPATRPTRDMITTMQELQRVTSSQAVFYFTPQPMLIEIQDSIPVGGIDLEQWTSAWVPSTLGADQRMELYSLIDKVGHSRDGWLVRKVRNPRRANNTPAVSGPSNEYSNEVLDSSSSEQTKLYAVELRGLLSSAERVRQAAGLIATPAVQIIKNYVGENIRVCAVSTESKDNINNWVKRRKQELVQIAEKPTGLWAPELPQPDAQRVGLWRPKLVSVTTQTPEDPNSIAVLGTQAAVERVSATSIGTQTPGTIVALEQRPSSSGSDYLPNLCAAFPLQSPVIVHRESSYVSPQMPASPLLLIVENKEAPKATGTESPYDSCKKNAEVQDEWAKSRWAKWTYNAETAGLTTKVPRKTLRMSQDHLSRTSRIPKPNGQTKVTRFSLESFPK